MTSRSSCGARYLDRTRSGSPTPKLSETIVPTGAYFQTESSLTKAEIEIATSSINAAWGAAYANYEHEIIGRSRVTSRRRRWKR